MKKAIQLLVILFLAISTFAQVDIRVPWRGPFGDVGRGLVWGASGIGGVNNAFIIELPAPQTSACLFVRNNSAATAHTFTLRAYTSSDQTAKGFYLSLSRWEPLNIVSPAWNPLGTVIYSVPVAGNAPGIAGGLIAFSIGPASGGRVAFVFSGSTVGGGTNTVDIFYSFGSPSPCSAFIPPPNGSIFVDARTITANTSVAWIGWGGVTAFPAAPQTWSSCSYYLYTQNTAGTTPTLNVYIQSQDSFTITLDDRVSFVQATTATLEQSAQILLDAEENPHTNLNGTLAAGTIVSGLFSDTVKIYYKIGGTAAPSYNVRLTGVCH